MEILDKIKAEFDAFDEKKKELVEGLQKNFPALFQPIFDKTDKIDSISWRQYTPYFNDGEPCEFNVYIDYLDINGEGEDEIDTIDWRIKYYLAGEEKYANLLEENPELDIDLYTNIEEFKESLGKIPDEFYLKLFGDHVKVTIYKNGSIEVEEYQHD